MTRDIPLLVAFGVGLLGPLYAYVIFPAAMALVARQTRARLAPAAARPEPRRPVTIVVPAHNEERSLEGKLRNVLASDYPRALLDVIVVSDASTDGTDDIARAFEDDGVRLIVQERRRGKTAGLNRALTVARGEIVVFTDANALYPPEAVGFLTRAFDDPAVGLVTGSTRYVARAGGIVEATNAYTRMERVIKTAESRWGCSVGADGAIFAVRRSLYRPLRDDDINDFVIPLSVIEQGRRCVFVDDAFCIEQPGRSVDSEFRRQARITNRTIRALWRHAGLLNPLRGGPFAFFLFSHKAIRFLVPALLTLAAASLTLLARTHVWAAAALVAAAVGGALAIGSRGTRVVRSRVGRVLALVDLFLTINAAVAEGWWRFLRGRTDVVWQHDRAAG
jgi:cellulose synthase/poly-beta-1,6-N-acetylglucosamine synthase-like glycosyltransferase